MGRILYYLYAAVVITVASVMAYTKDTNNGGSGYRSGSGYSSSGGYSGGGGGRHK
jgi:uncharacterized membrane protein YgcG